MEKRLPVVYDDTCAVCSAVKDFSERRDVEKYIDFVGMHTERGRELVHEYNLDMHESAYALDGDQIIAKSKMVHAVLAHNGTIGFILSLPFRIPWFGDRLYEFLSLHRYHEI